MDADLLLIFGFVLTIVMIVLTFGTVAGQRDRAHKIRRLEMEVRIEEAKAQQSALAHDLQQDFEDRLRVLERIVTDPSADLSRQIEDLRELQRIDAKAERENVS